MPGYTLRTWGAAVLRPYVTEVGGFKFSRGLTMAWIEGALKRAHQQPKMEAAKLRWPSGAEL